MAAFQQFAATTTYFLRHSHRLFTINTHPNTKKPFIVLSQFHTSPFLSKPTKRKNHLRQKLLKKTLITSDPKTHLEFPPIQEKETEKFESLSLDTINEQVQFSIADDINNNNNNINVGVLAKGPFLKYGLWLFGAIVFQAVCVVWFFGDFDSETENLSRSENGRVLEVGENGEYGVSSVSYVNELEMERKIQEIRVMAREAREKERLESKKSGFDSDYEDEEMEEKSSAKSGIEEEVEGGLIKLKKKLEKARDTGTFGYSRKGNLGEREGNEALMFKKKHKFKGLTGDSREKPRGFISSDDKNIDKLGESGSLEKGDKKYENGIIILREDEKLAEQYSADPKESDAVLGVDEDQKTTNKKATRGRETRKQGKDKMLRNPKDKIYEKSAIAEDVKSNELSNVNGSLKGNGVDNAKSVTSGNNETDVWWFNLPYVLAILMQRGNNGEGGEGLYTLKSISSSHDQKSHVVAFEDRVDATNFCYLLQSFFDDLEDFNADIVPVTVKELKEEVKMRTMRVIVVKKGQLRLYAGQPLADAEMALRDIVRQQ